MDPLGEAPRRGNTIMFFPVLPKLTPPSLCFPNHPTPSAPMEIWVGLALGEWGWAVCIVSRLPQGGCLCFHKGPKLVCWESQVQAMIYF